MAEDSLGVVERNFRVAERNFRVAERNFRVAESRASCYSRTLHHLKIPRKLPTNHFIIPHFFQFNFVIHLAGVACGCGEGCGMSWVSASRS